MFPYLQQAEYLLSSMLRCDTYITTLLSHDFDVHQFLVHNNEK